MRGRRCCNIVVENVAERGSVEAVLVGVFGVFGLSSVFSGAGAESTVVWVAYE